MWPVAVIFAVFFIVFAGIELTVIRRMTGHKVESVFDLMFVLFEAFWLLGWSVGVAILGLAAILFLFYRESARLQNGKLIYAPRLGPLNIILDYDLAKVSNVRTEKGGAEGLARVRFDYGGGPVALGDTMRQADADKIVSAIRNASSVAALTSRTPDVPRADIVPDASRPKDAAVASTPPIGASPSALALVAANILPLIGVLFLGWDLVSVIVLYWAESAVIAFYTVLKIAMVGKLAALVHVPFFVGHFGGFMAGHFLFIYGIFVRGIGPFSPEPAIRDALLGIFNPVWMPLAGLFFSHGVSFVSNFVGRREYSITTVNALMTAPYKRIVIMQLALIFGAWIIMIFKSPVWALVLLVVLKTIVDLSAHRKEHAGPTVATTL